MQKQRPGLFMDVDLKNPAEEIVPEDEVVELPPPPKEKPNESEIFKQNDLVLKKPEKTKGPYRKTDQKRTLTPKMEAHLKNIRAKSAETRRLKKLEKEGKTGVENTPPPVEEPQNQQVRRVPTPVPPQTPVSQPQYQAPVIDYDRIINGVYSRQQEHHTKQRQMDEWREQVRKEERAKALQQSQSLFMEG